MGWFRRRSKDEFKELSTQRRSVEDERAWFEGEDDGPELEVETGVGSNLRRPERP